jgi:hypothetical protein
MNFPPETKDLSDHGPANDHDNTLMIYLVGRMGLGLNQHNGVASPAKYVATADRRFRNKVILSNSRPRDYTAAHEALHVLSDAAHGSPPYNDFNAEYTNENTIWTVPPTTPIDESERRNNSSIGSTKRISLAQETAIHFSPLAK